MSGEVFTGALARDRMERDPAVAAACDDLARLADFGALAEVAVLIRERRRQAEAQDARTGIDYAALTGQFWVSIVRSDGTEDRGYPAIAADGTWRYFVPAGVRLFGAQAVAAGDVVSGKMDLSEW